MTRLSLETCLESLSRLEYLEVVTDLGYHWPLAQLLETLRQRSSDRLALPVSVWLPRPGQAGTISSRGGHGGGIVRYRIEDRRLTTSAN